MKSLSRVRLFATPWTVAYQAPVVHGIFQARVLEWVAISFSRVFPNPGIEPGSPILQADALPSEPPGRPWQTQGRVFNPGEGNNVCEKLCLHHPAGGVWGQNYHPAGGVWG